MPKDKIQARKKLTRRSFLKLALAGLAAIGIGNSTQVYAFGIDLRDPMVESTDVKLKKLPAGLDGLTIGQLTDLHVGPLVDASQVARAAKALMAHTPDLITLTGDFISRSADYAASCANALAQLSAPLGVFAVLGNHDYWAGRIDETIAQLERVGIRVLRNENVTIGAGNGRICLIGVDDVWDTQPNLPLAMAGVSQDMCKIALVHHPDYVEETAKYEVDLQLSGHSHGGQVRLPFIGALFLPAMAIKYPMGLQWVNAHTQIYTSRGIGDVALPVRFNCSPEVTLLRLRRG